jgi:hypothetical protein
MERKLKRNEENNIPRDFTICTSTIVRSQDSSVSIAMSYGTESQEIGV